MQQSSQVETTSAPTLPESNVLAISQDAQASKNTQAPSGNRFLIILSMVALYFLWGTTYLAMRIGLLGFPPFLMAGIRFLLAGSILYTVLRLRGSAAPSRAQWMASVLIGILLLEIGNGGIVFAEQWVSTELASVAGAAVQLWAALFAAFCGPWP